MPRALQKLHKGEKHSTKVGEDQDNHRKHKKTLIRPSPLSAGLGRFVDLLSKSTPKSPDKPCHRIWRGGGAAAPSLTEL